MLLNHKGIARSQSENSPKMLYFSSLYTCFIIVWVPYAQRESVFGEEHVKETTQENIMGDLEPKISNFNIV